MRRERISTRPLGKSKMPPSCFCCDLINPWQLRLVDFTDPDGIESWSKEVWACKTVGCKGIWISDKQNEEMLYERIVFRGNLKKKLL